MHHYHDAAEEWRPAVGRLGGFTIEVSNIGRVKNSRTGRILSLSRNHKGYHTVRFGSGPNFFVHRAVYEAFVGEIPDGMQINHMDCNKQNNKVRNLELVTPQENIRHAVENGLMASRLPTDKSRAASKKKSRPLLPDDRMGICKLRRTNAMTVGEIAALFGICKSTVQSCVNGRWASPRRRGNWVPKHVDKPHFAADNPQ